MKIIVGITGASGTQLGFKLLSLIPKEIEVFAIVSKSAKKALKLEENQKFKELKNVTYKSLGLKPPPVASTLE